MSLRTSEAWVRTPEDERYQLMVMQALLRVRRMVDVSEHEALSPRLYSKAQRDLFQLAMSEVRAELRRFVNAKLQIAQADLRPALPSDEQPTLVMWRKRRKP